MLNGHMVQLICDRMQGEAGGGEVPLSVAVVFVVVVFVVVVVIVVVVFVAAIDVDVVVIFDPRNLPLKSGSNWVNNS